MGKRKARKLKPKAKPKLPKVPTIFDCPFCNQEKSVGVSIDKSTMIAKIRCSMCTADFQTTAGYLDEPIDLYCKWIDKCKEVNAREAGRSREDDPDEDYEEEEEEEDELEPD
ncbi:putative Transcription elongation factor 1 [Monocercomonoides exilis]|uniref:putative Transcription elongation factor 1 n=1 Tax=Monocercomonoides exilis TaxID=2049356 RepID=UPI0035594A27|nr:putative Transcription elongation factor 1 [Monocercomonoides exilis]